jgi:hypothetical protein
MKTHFKKLTIVAIAAAMSFLAACKKDQDRTPPSADYKVTNMTLVNNEDGQPRLFNTLPVLGDQTVTLSNEALSAGHVAVKNAAGENLLLIIVGNKDGELTLEQNYVATGGQASGTINYTLTKI